MSVAVAPLSFVALGIAVPLTVARLVVTTVSFFVLLFRKFFCVALLVIRPIVDILLLGCFVSSTQMQDFCVVVALTGPTRSYKTPTQKARTNTTRMLIFRKVFLKCINNWRSNQGVNVDFNPVQTAFTFELRCYTLLQLGQYMP